MCVQEKHLPEDIYFFIQSQYFYLRKPIKKKFKNKNKNKKLRYGWENDQIHAHEVHVNDQTLTLTLMSCTFLTWLFPYSGSGQPEKPFIFGITRNTHELPKLGSDAMGTIHNLESWCWIQVIPSLIIKVSLGFLFLQSVCFGEHSLIHFHQITIFFHAFHGMS